MIEKLKKVFFLILLFIPIFSFSNRLDSIAYKNGELALTFSEKVPRYIEKYDDNLPSVTLNFNETYKNKNVEQVIEINDSYIMDILSENYEKQTDVVIYMQPRMTYTIYAVGRELRIRFKEVSVKRKKYTIVLDAGRGGHDSGAIGDNNHYEKNLALGVVLELYKELKDDYKVVLTRDSDIFIPLNKRADIGNENNADLFVSVHLNASTNSSSNGTEVFYFSKNPSVYARQIAKYENDFDKTGTRAIEASNFVISDVLYHLNQQQSALLANSVLDEIVDSMKTVKRKATGANFAVLRGSSSNSILIELGFITNYNDREKYSSVYGQRRVAKAIADAIRKHY